MKNNIKDSLAKFIKILKYLIKMRQLFLVDNWYDNKIQETLLSILSFK